MLDGVEDAAVGAFAAAGQHERAACGTDDPGLDALQIILSLRRADAGGIGERGIADVERALLRLGGDGKCVGVGTGKPGLQFLGCVAFHLGGGGRKNNAVVHDCFSFLV